MTTFFSDVLAYFWPWGVILFLLGFLLSDVFGYFYHKYVLHGVVLSGSENRFGTGRLSFLFVVWKTAWEKHMWHHYKMYPDPDAPGIKAGPFRPHHDYYNGLELAKHRFGSVPSENARFDYVEWLLHKIGFKASLDWIIASALWGVVVIFIMSPFVESVWISFPYFLAGGIVLGMKNSVLHKSFHCIPYERLRDMPLKSWLKPSTVAANLGEHVPLLNRYYRYLLRLHVAHHYVAIPIDNSNHEYMDVMPNANTANFTMFNPLTDLVFGTYSGIAFNEIKRPSNADKIRVIKKWQACGHVHELTCGVNSLHEPLKPVESGGDVVLICPTCKHVQRYIPDAVLDSEDYLDNIPRLGERSDD